MMVKELKVVGKRVRAIDAIDKVTGSVQYAGDISVSGMLHAKVLRSPHPHAKIRNIDTSKAEAQPGVKAVITYKDFPAKEWVEFYSNWKGPVMDARVRFVGNEVAAVAAEDEETAEDALSLIKVEYETLPAVYDVLEAMKSGAPLVRPGGTNETQHAVTTWGDVETGFRQADFVIEHFSRMGNQHYSPLDRNACIASWQGDELTLWTTTQTIFELRDIVAEYLDMPMSKVRVFVPPTGGSFGFYWINNFVFIPIFLARKAGRPVRLELTREEQMMAVKRREGSVSWVRLGVRKDGTFTAADYKHILDNGAYGAKFAPYQTVSDLYPVPHGRLETFGVATNLVTGGCMRGVGDVSLGMAIEQAVDKAAEKLGMDPVEMRIKNHFRTGDPLRSSDYVWDYFPSVPRVNCILSSCGLEDAIKKGAELIGWKQKWKGWRTPISVDGSRRGGIGMAISTHISGLPYIGPSAAVVKIDRDGSVTLLTGVGRMGQGADTTQAQIAAEALGVPFEAVSVVAGDSGACPWTVPTLASISAHMTGLATKAAASDARRQALELAARTLKEKAEDLDIEDGRVYVKGNPDKGLTLRELLSAPLPEYATFPAITAGAWANVELERSAKMTMAHFAEVEVDTETGQVKVLKYVAVHDSGKLINPAMTENQVLGGYFQGCGYSLSEDLVFEKETGMVLNADLLNYKVLTSLDLPSPTTAFVEPIDPLGPYGVKGIGEGTTCPEGACLTSAVYNAIGVMLDVPITPDRVLKALGKA